MGKRKPKIKHYKDEKGEWRWTLTASNGRIIDASSEGFDRRKTSVDNAKNTGLSLFEIYFPERIKD